MLSPDQLDTLFTFIEVLCQTIAYGIFVAIIPMSTHVLFKQGMNVRSNVIMLVIALGIFALSTAYWAVSVASLISKITLEQVHRNTVIRQVFNAAVLVNYLFADGVVVWRMRVLCAARFSNKIMIIPSIVLGLTALSVSATIVLRSAVAAAPNGDVPRHGGLATALDVTQIVNLVFSLTTNVIATSIIGVWAWQYRRSIRANFKSSKSASTQVERILVLLAESGLVYCVSSFIVLLGSFIHVPGGTLGDIYTGIHVQIAGMYPALIMILVNTQRTSNALTSVSVSNPTPPRSAHKTEVLESMHFNENTVARQGTIGIVSRQTHDSAMFNVTVEMPSQASTFSTVMEESVRSIDVRSSSEDDQRHDKDEMV